MHASEGIIGGKYLLVRLGWRFVTPDEQLPGEYVHPNPVHPEFTHLRDIYLFVNPEYQGRFTVPMLYDTKTKTIVNNEVNS